MMGYHFIDDDGTFQLEQPENYSGLYFPIAGESGLKSAVTPELGGDSKVDQNSFLLEPVSIENLHNNRSTRNFWCHVENVGCWSAAGVSAEQLADKFTDRQEQSSLTAGPMWQTVTRRSEKYKLRAALTSFVPVDADVEVLYIEITNIGENRTELTPTAAIPMYARSADNIRDHRHVTALLHRIKTTDCGVWVTPTLSFDERGHRKNDRTYFVCGFTGTGERPVEFYPVAADFIGEGGNFERPAAIVKHLQGVAAGEEFAGMEAFGGLRFDRISLKPGETAAYTVLIGTAAPGEDAAAPEHKSGPYSVPHRVTRGVLERFKTGEAVKRELSQVKRYWEEKINVAYRTGDADFDRFMHWVSFQPILRRIYGCSFLPHHDYGKGGRGWRDLWQDCLALLLMNPEGVREMLLSNFGGVRMDGTNATIIGTGQGEFIADRNDIARVWMDHGVWPFFTAKLYLDQTGDLGLLYQRAPYFKDRQTARGTKTDDAWNDAYGSRQRTEDGAVYEGTVLEHLLLQNLTAFYEVGEHGHCRLRGADWNDALDMAPERGESVAFTNAYAKNLSDLAGLLHELKRRGQTTVTLSENIGLLLTDEMALYDSVEEKQRLLAHYLDTCLHNISGAAAEFSVEALAESLSHKAEWMRAHIRKTEWVEDADGNGWFNGYYDNHGRRVEGVLDGGVRMMLTGQVFSIMADTAEVEQVKRIVRSADAYLYRKELGGYRLNTDFGEVKMDLGRMFGFAYGEKENGAVFSHMAVMYANALYQRGFVREGYKALDALEKQSLDFPVSRIYPGLPEYFNARGRGMYHYLTGAASWYMLTVITEMFGIKGEYGELLLWPKLLDCQFQTENREISAGLDFGGRHFLVVYRKEGRADYGTYKITDVKLNGSAIPDLQMKKDGRAAFVPKEALGRLDAEQRHCILVTLSSCTERK